MTLDWPTNQIIRRAVIALAVAVGYFALATIGTILSVPPSGFATIWPATSFLTSVLLLTPVRLWWIYPVAVVPAHFAVVSVFEPVPLVVALTQIGGNFLLAISTALALRSADGKPPDFGQLRALLRFFLLGAVAVPAVVNSLILLVHLATGKTDDFWLSWGQWMMATMFPAITIPAVLVPAITRFARRQVDFRYLSELALLSAVTFVLGFIAFDVEAGEWGPALRLLPLPALLWAAVRLGVAGSGASLLVFALAIVTQPPDSGGPFANGAPSDGVIALQAYLTAISVPLMMLAALLEERRRTMDLLGRSEARMAVVAASTDTGLWQWDERARKLWLTDHCRSMFGIGANVEVTPPMILGIVHPDDRARVARAMRAALSSAETAPREFRIACPDGEERWFSLLTRTTFDKDNEPILVSGMFQDVTQRVGAQDEAEKLTRRLLTLQDDERRSIARELHDFTSQHLVAADLDAGALKRSAKDGEVRRLADRIAASVQNAMNEIRTFTFLLQPPELENEELSEVLHRYLEGFRRRTATQTSLRISPLADRLPPEQRRTILRVVQESLANIHRNAGATNVSVDVRCIGGRLHLVINDDGRGGKRLFEPDGGEHLMGLPIPGTAARIRQLGGKIEVSSRRARTTVHVAVPIAAADRKPAA